MVDEVMAALDREDAETQKIKAELIAERNRCAKLGLHFVLPGDAELSIVNLKETSGGKQ